MKLRNDSIIFSSEFGLLIVILILFCQSMSNIYPGPLDLVHQFESFQDLIDSLVRCHPIKDEINQEKLFSQSPEVYTTTDMASNLKSKMPQCPIDKERFKYFKDYELNMWLNYRHIQPGGKFKPIGCESLQKVAIVVPYRNRQDHLEKFSLYIHQFLPDQLIEYTLYVIEQNDEKPFNRAKLFNVGVSEITKIDSKICCFIFHDVDLLPLDQKNLYMCSSRPRHLSPSVNTLRFRLLYTGLFGGVISMTKDQYDGIGGFSNDMFGWGGEDDDIFRRIMTAGYGIDRTSREHGVYIMMRHRKAEPNPLRYQLLRESERNVSNEAHGAAASRASYKLESINKEQLFTVISVRL